MQSIRCLPAPACLGPAPRVGRPARARPALRPRAFDPESEDTPGVATLLERDVKSVDLDADKLMAAFADDEPQPQKQKQKQQKGGKGAAAAAPTQQQQDGESEAAPRPGERGPASQRADKLRTEADTPRRARDAIELGLNKYAAKEYQAALDLFQLSLELPGSGFMRLAGSPKEYACASEGEENAALYNMACCWAALGQRQSALTVLEALLDNNFDDYAAIRSDPDLAPLRGPELDKLLAKHDGLVAKLFGGQKKASGSGNKPWLQW